MEIRAQIMEIRARSPYLHDNVAISATVTPEKVYSGVERLRKRRGRVILLD